MSNATLAVYGRLGSDPREHETRKGGTMATASLAVDVPDRSQGAGEGAEETLWLRVTAFGRVAESLAGHSKGDPVSVSGRLQFSRYQARDGADREQWQIVADALVSARTVPRAAGGARRRVRAPAGTTTTSGGTAMTATRIPVTRRRVQAVASPPRRPMTSTTTFRFERGDEPGPSSLR